MKESAFWQTIKKHLDSADIHISRIESSTGSGVSDVTACRNGVSPWLELKVFHGNRLYFRNSQRVWIKNRTDVGGHVLVVARKDALHKTIGPPDTIFVYDARLVVLCPSKPSTDNKSFSIDVDDLPQPLCKTYKPFDWNLIRETIFDPTPANLPEHLD